MATTSEALHDQYINQGRACHQRGDFEQAAACFREAARVDPRSALALSNLAGSLRALARHDEALDALRSAAVLEPAAAEIRYNLALVLMDRGDTSGAADAYRSALVLWPDFPEALLNYSNLLLGLSRFDEVLAVCRCAIQANPRLAVAHFQKGLAWHEQGRWPEAVAAYEQALRCEPNYPDACNNLAAALNAEGSSDTALEACRQGLELAPQRASLYSHLATALHALARGDEATRARRKCVALDPANAVEHANLLYALNFQADSVPLSVFEEHVAWARRHAEPLTAAAAPHNNDRTPVRRLRLGYVSPFFREHAVSHFSEPLIAQRDGSQFEVYCYSDLRGDPDSVTERFRAAADHWRHVAGMSDEQLAEQVRADRIDVLVDLTGHISGGRLLAFARRAAPVQVTYLGYQNTTGMSAIDYRLTDAHADPPGSTERCYTEQLIRLAPAFFCFNPADDAPAVSLLPALKRGHVTFGAFNNLAKVNPGVLDAWLAILQGVPGARLHMLGQSGGSFAARVRELATARGLDPGRIEFFGKRPYCDYLQRIADVDIALDPFPFQGHTTTCDALWMGVPVVSLAGATYASRFGTSALVNLALDDWIGRTVDDYVATAKRWAGNLDALATLRRQLRERMTASPLTDGAAFTKQVEAAYREMWRRWCGD